MDWKFLVLILALANLLLLAESRSNRTRGTRRPNLRRRISTAKDQDLTSAGSTSVSTRVTKSSNDKLLVCYYTNWSQYRPKVGKFLPEDIPADLCTHVIFAFGWLKKGKLSSFETNDETKDGKTGLYDRINALKKANSKLKTLLAIGGWSFGTQKFKEMSATRYTRQTFIFSAISYLRDRNFDGLDIDWEYPKGSEDKVNYIALLKDLREAFEAEAEETGKPTLLLSAAVPVGPDSIRGGYDVPAVNKYLDFINLMAYDFHGKWESQTGHNAPLYAPSSDSVWRKQLSVSHAAETWVELGASREKLIIGMPTYGRSFTLSNKNNFSVNVATSGGGTAGVYTKEGGFLAYYEICEILLSKTAQYIWDDEMKVPYMVQDNQWVGFDDERSIRNKMQWVKENKFGGAMVWTVDMDDFTGTVCSKNKNKYPLITVMSEELFGAKRGFKDTDWAKLSPSKQVVVPEPIAISVKEVLKRRRTTQKPLAIEDNEDSSLEDGNTRPGAVVCYFTAWSAKRSGIGKFGVENIDPKLCTHVIYAFAGVKDSKINANEDTIEKLVKLKEKNADLKVIVSIGGWQHGAKLFKDLTKNIYKRNQFVYNTLEYLREVELDGLDIDWEFPKDEEDKEAHLDLVRELRLAFEGEAKSMKLERLLLTVAVSGNPNIILNGYDTAELSKYVDFFNVMTYDYHGQWESVIGHNAPLFGIDEASTDYPLTVANGIKIWAKEAPREKILLGMPTYGRSFTLKNAEKFDIGAEVAGPGKQADYTKEDGFLAYYEVCDFLHSDNTTLVWDNEQMVPFAYNDLQWVGFDDERSFKNKVDWLKEQGIGGVMLWSLDLDDFKGQSCGTKYPLLKTIAAEMEGYRVTLSYDGPLEGSGPGKQAKTDTNEITCAEEDGHISYHRDQVDCTKYYMCEGERKHHMPCPAQLVFNSNENVCDWPENVEGCQNTFTS